MIQTTFTAFISEVNGEEVNGRTRVQLRYDFETDPLAVTVAFHAGEEDGGIPWIIGLDLLDEAANSEKGDTVGMGDIRFQRSVTTLKACLNVPEGHSDVLFPMYAVNQFLSKVHSLDMTAIARCIDDKVDALVEEILNA